MKRYIPLIALALFAGIAATTLRAEEAAPVEDLKIVTSAGVEHAFKVEIADTPAESERGLMNRTEMPADHGMLFEFTAPRSVAFWMKDTLIPLDIVYIAQNGEIVRITHAKPQDLSPLPSGGLVTGVVELNGGTSEKLGIKIGDRVVHPFFRN